MSCNSFPLERSRRTGDIIYERAGVDGSVSTIDDIIVCRPNYILYKERLLLQVPEIERATQSDISRVGYCRVVVAFILVCGRTI